MNYLKIDIRPGGRNAFSTAVELDGVTIRFSFRWLPKIGRWFCMFRDPSNVLLGTGMVAPGSEIYLDIRDPRVPSGRMGWSGPDPYYRDDLGALVNLYYLPVNQ